MSYIYNNNNTNILVLLYADIICTTYIYVLCIYIAYSRLQREVCVWKKSITHEMKLVHYKTPPSSNFNNKIKFFTCTFYIFN